MDQVPDTESDAPPRDATSPPEQDGVLAGIWQTTPVSAFFLLALICTTIGLIVFDQFVAPVPDLALLSTVMLLTSLALSARLLVHLQRRRRAHDLAMQGAHDGFWSWDPRTKQLEVGQRFLNILGYDLNCLPDTHAWMELVHPDDRDEYSRTVTSYLKGNTPHFYGEYRVRAKSGDYCWIASRGLAKWDRNGRAYLMAGSVTDITERKNREEENKFLAFHDYLTALPNRLLLAERVAKALEQAATDKHRAAIMFIDLDRFQDINNTLGHDVGDQLLKNVALRLGRVLDDRYTLARQGGDEFIVLLPEVADEQAALAIGHSLLDALRQPFHDMEHEFLIGASIGLSLYPDHGLESGMLLRYADTAMYEAKAAGGNTIRPYSSPMNQRIQSRVSMELRLRHALEKGELELYYQPQIEISSGRLIGAEALLRWHVDGGLIPPVEFIPVAETSGLIVSIGVWVIETAIAQAAEWRRQFGEAPRLAINLSPRQFAGGQLARCVLDNLNRWQLPTEAIELEITESILLHPEGDSIDELRSLHAHGLRLSLDDFGTGYSSLSYLQRLPIDVLKIDRSFITPLGSDQANAIVRAIIAMAHSLDLLVVAEGVETEQQLSILRLLRCDIAQGYLYSKPLPAQAFMDLLLRRSA
ncbi:putative bifunctional diguanylate cyclase/phosphodiesterase [Rhodoferax ferrireducens]|uniref:putative bifunctional diguanylate cyclase/phosphodiesterase n=1 Tax=Rhodoferax ferrireducens TaxID=192843 RepID=UPI000E0DAEC4|nr:GGDEF domain-containing phosphodiesterase [Rhodoferax ferrireducens]